MKILALNGRAGSIPAPGTLNQRITASLRFSSEPEAGPSAARGIVVPEHQSKHEGDAECRKAESAEDIKYKRSG